MSDLTDVKCAMCGGQLERVRYFPRQLLTADDMRVEQEYFREKARRHNRYLHGWGVVCGCVVEQVTDAKTWTVRVCPGYVVSPQGDEILINDCSDLDLKTGASPDPCTVRWPCPPLGTMPAVGRDDLTTVYVAVRYAECFWRPTRVHPFKRSVMLSRHGVQQRSPRKTNRRFSCAITSLWFSTTQAKRMQACTPFGNSTMPKKLLFTEPQSYTDQTLVPFD